MTSRELNIRLRISDAEAVIEKEGVMANGMDQLWILRNLRHYLSEEVNRRETNIAAKHRDEEAS